MRKILDDIKNKTYNRIYLLYGEEGYLKTQYKNKLVSAICGDDTMNFSYFEGKGIDIKEVIGISETLPFFADKRVIIIENSGWFQKGGDKMAEYFASGRKKIIKR